MCSSTWPAAKTENTPAVKAASVVNATTTLRTNENRAGNFYFTEEETNVSLLSSQRAADCPAALSGGTATADATRLSNEHVRGTAELAVLGLQMRHFEAAGR